MPGLSPEHRSARVPSVRSLDTSPQPPVPTQQPGSPLGQLSFAPEAPELKPREAPSAGHVPVRPWLGPARYEIVMLGQVGDLVARWLPWWTQSQAQDKGRRVAPPVLPLVSTLPCPVLSCKDCRGVRVSEGTWGPTCHSERQSSCPELSH